MTPPQKPEWMELADADAVPSPKKVSRLIPALIAAAALAIVGIGAIASQISDEAPANATEQVNSVQSSSAPVVIQPNSQVATNTTTPDSAKSSQAVQAPKQPGISTLPNNGGENERNGRSEHEGSDNHENEDD